jgi:hypothetical protein
MTLRAVAGGGGSVSAPLILDSGTLTASNPVEQLSQTWNNSGTTFTGYKINITDTASTTASLIADYQVGGSSKFSVRKDGGLLLSMNAGNVWGLLDNGSGVFAFVNGGFTGTQMFGVGQGAARVSSTELIGWTANSTVTVGLDTAIARTQAKVLEVNTGTAGTYTGTALLLGAYAVASLPAASAALKGARASVSDATQAWTSANYGATVTGGGTNFCPVICDGTNWRIG